MSDKIQPRIYVACLAAYNNGFLHGKWIDANQDAEAIREEITEILSSSPVEGSEEWSIHSYEGFGSLSLSETEDLDHLAELGYFISEHTELGIALLAYTNNDIDRAQYLMEECYQGQFNSDGDKLFYK